MQGCSPRGHWAVPVLWTGPAPGTEHIHDCKWHFEAFPSLYAAQMAVPMGCHLHPCKLQITSNSIQNFQISLSISQRFCSESFLFFFFEIYLFCRIHVRESCFEYLFININQLDALNFIISLFQASTCFEHMCSLSGGQKLYYTLSGIITICTPEGHL